MSRPPEDWWDDMARMAREVAFESCLLAPHVPTKEEDRIARMDMPPSFRGSTDPHPADVFLAWVAGRCGIDPKDIDAVVLDWRTARVSVQVRPRADLISIEITTIPLECDS